MTDWIPWIRHSGCKYTHSFRGLVHEICTRYPHATPMEAASWLRSKRRRTDYGFWLYDVRDFVLPHRRRYRYGDIDELEPQAIIARTTCCERCGENLDIPYRKYGCIAWGVEDECPIEWDETPLPPPRSGEVVDQGMFTVVRHRARTYFSRLGAESIIDGAQERFGLPCRGCGELTYDVHYWGRYSWSYLISSTPLCEACARHVERVECREMKRVFGVRSKYANPKMPWPFDNQMKDYVLAVWALERGKEVLREHRKREVGAGRVDEGARRVGPG